MINIKNIVTETSDLAYQQGDKLDIISDDIFHTYKNMSLANTELAEANQHQRKSKRKYIALSFIILIIVGAILGITFAL